MNPVLAPHQFAAIASCFSYKWYSVSEKKKLVVRTLTVEGVTPPLQGWLPASVLRFCVLCALLTSGSLNWISAGLPRGSGGGGGAALNNWGESAASGFAQSWKVLEFLSAWNVVTWKMFFDSGCPRQNINHSLENFNFIYVRRSMFCAIINYQLRQLNCKM